MTPTLTFVIQGESEAESRRLTCTRSASHSPRSQGLLLGPLVLWFFFFLGKAPVVFLFSLLN